MRRLFLLACISLPAYLGAQASFHEAERFYEAEEYETAVQAYRQLEETATRPLDKISAAYDRGLALAADESWHEASTIFRRLLEDPKKIPLRLKLAIQEAFVLTLIMQAREAVKEPTKANIASDWLDEARKVLKEIRLHRHGPYVDELGKWLNSVEVEVNELQRNVFVIPENATNAFWKIQLVLIGFKSHLSDLKSLEDNPKLLEAYQSVYLAQDKRMLPLFENLEKIIPEEQSKQVQRMASGVEGYMRALKNLDLKKAEASLAQAEEGFDGWTDVLFVKEKETGILVKLIALYTLALRSEFIPSKTVEVLLQNFREANIKGDQKELIESQKYAELASKALAEGLQVHARIYLETGQNMLAQKLYKSEKERFTTLDILTIALYAQSHAAKLVRLLVMHPIAEDRALLELLAQAQKNVIGILSTFPSTVYKQQKEGFAFTEKKTGRCQHRPWNEVLPLFYKAWAAAERAHGNNLAQVLQEQEEALHYLGEAAALLKKPVPPGDDSCYKKSPPPPPKKDEKGGQKQQKQPQMDEVMRQIQEMEQDDKIEKRQNVIRRGSKPW